MVRVVLVAVLAVVLSGCGRGETKDYAAAFSGWFDVVMLDNGNADPDLSHALEPKGVPEPPKPPHEIYLEHALLVEAIRLEAQAASERLYRSTIVGIAAAFCDPRREGATGQSVYSEAVAIQIWRINGKRCDQERRWLGPLVLDSNNHLIPLTTPQRYNAPCDNKFGQEFDVAVTEFGWICEIDRRAATARSNAEQVWAKALIDLCGASSMPGADALEAIERCR